MSTSETYQSLQAVIIKHVTNNACCCITDDTWTGSSSTPLQIGQSSSSSISPSNLAMSYPISRFCHTGQQYNSDQYQCYWSAHSCELSKILESSLMAKEQKNHTYQRTAISSITLSAIFFSFNICYLTTCILTTNIAGGA